MKSFVHTFAAPRTWCFLIACSVLLHGSVSAADDASVQSPIKTLQKAGISTSGAASKKRGLYMRKRDGQLVYQSNDNKWFNAYYDAANGKLVVDSSGPKVSDPTIPAVADQYEKMSYADALARARAENAVPAPVGAPAPAVADTDAKYEVFTAKGKKYTFNPVTNIFIGSDGTASAYAPDATAKNTVQLKSGYPANLRPEALRPHAPPAPPVTAIDAPPAARPVSPAAGAGTGATQWHTLKDMTAAQTGSVITVENGTKYLHIPADVQISDTRTIEAGYYKLRVISGTEIQVAKTREATEPDTGSSNPFVDFYEETTGKKLADTTASAPAALAAPDTLVSGDEAARDGSMTYAAVVAANSVAPTTDTEEYFEKDGAYYVILTNAAGTYSYKLSYKESSEDYCVSSLLEGEIPADATPSSRDDAADYFRSIHPIERKEVFLPKLDDPDAIQKTLIGKNATGEWFSCGRRGPLALDDKIADTNQPLAFKEFHEVEGPVDCEVTEVVPGKKWITKNEAGTLTTIFIKTNDQRYMGLTHDEVKAPENAATGFLKGDDHVFWRMEKPEDCTSGKYRPYEKEDDASGRFRQQGTGRVYCIDGSNVLSRCNSMSKLSDITAEEKPYNLKAVLADQAVSTGAAAPAPLKFKPAGKGFLTAPRAMMAAFLALVVGAAARLKVLSKQGISLVYAGKAQRSLEARAADQRALAELNVFDRTLVRFVRAGNAAGSSIGTSINNFARWATSKMRSKKA